MNILIGTDILLCFLLKSDFIDGVYLLFKWLDKIKANKIVDASSTAILTNFAPLKDFEKLNTFTPLRKVPTPTIKINCIKEKLAQKTYIEQKGATSILAHLNLLDTNEVDFLITENPLTHSLAFDMGLDEKVYSIENFIERCCMEYRELDESKGAIVKMCKLGDLSLNDPFFYDFKKEYSPKYCNWFKKKSNDDVFISTDSNLRLRALLKLKVEDETEDYSHISPPFRKERRLKICSFKVNYNGQKLGERFLRIIFEKALEEQVDSIYVTIFDNSKLRKRLIKMISQWGFTKVGEIESNKRHKEQVYAKNLHKDFIGNIKEKYPKHDFPTQTYFITLSTSYVQQLLPNDTLFKDHLDILPSKHAIQKVLVLNECDSIIQEKSGLLFYHKSSEQKDCKLVAVGLVEKVFSEFENEKDFINRCRKRSTLTKEELNRFWDKAHGTPIVIHFLYICGIEENNINNDIIKSYDLNVSDFKIQSSHIIEKDLYYKLLKGTRYEMYLNVN